MPKLTSIMHCGEAKVAAQNFSPSKKRKNQNVGTPVTSLSSQFSELASVASPKRFLASKSEDGSPVPRLDSYLFRPSTIAQSPEASSRSRSSRSSTSSRASVLPSSTCVPDLPPRSSSGMCNLLVFVLTWNQNKSSRRAIEGFAPPGHHIYFFGTQDCTFGSRQRWEQDLAVMLGSGYLRLHGCSLNALHVVVFVAVNLMPFISEVQTSEHSDSKISGTGSLALSFFVGTTSLVFVNSHFPSGQSVLELNRHFEETDVRIGQKLEPLSGGTPFGHFNTRTAKPPPVTRRGSRCVDVLPTALVDSGRDDEDEDELPLHPPNFYHSGAPISEKFDRAFWLGDLNYRICGNQQCVNSLLHDGMFQVLLANDQLTTERIANRAFAGFDEGILSFFPTYKYVPGTNSYDTSRGNIPAWTDRVLYKASNSARAWEELSQSLEGVPVDVVEYGSVDCVSGTHRPVFASFKCRVRMAKLKRPKQ